MFEKLNVPVEWKNSFTKYPHGYTIFEAICEWTKQVDLMVDQLNLTQVQIDKLFTDTLPENVENVLNTWYTSGQLADLINIDLLAMKASEVDMINVKSQLEDITINVKSYGAKGDGVTDDTNAIQSALDFVDSKGGGTVLIPNGTYMIKAHSPETIEINYLRNEGGISIKDNTSLLISDGAILKAIPNNYPQYQIIRIVDRNNVKISGGTIQGERADHVGLVGEWGYGIGVLGSTNVIIENINVIDCWGDGINLQVGADNIGSNICKNVIISNVLCDNNRRDGMAIEGVDNCIIKNSIFSNTIGTQGEHGIDIEPWDNAIVCKRITLENCLFENNNGSGLMIMMPNTKEVTINGCKFINNKDQMYSQGQLKTQNDPSYITVRNCLFEKGLNGCVIGIEFRNTNNCIAENNRFINNAISINRDAPHNIFNFKIADNIFQFLNFNYDYFVSTSQDLSYLNVEGNMFDAINNAGTSQGYININGSYLNVLRNKFLRIKHGVGIVGAMAIIKNNEFHGCDFESGNMLGNSMVIEDNIISGSCHQNNEQSAIRILAGSDYTSIKNNIFYAKSFVPVNGAGYSGSAIELTSSIVGAVVKGNITIPINDAIPYDVIRSNYNSTNNKIEIGSTNIRPSKHNKGDMYFDTTINKPIWWNGSNWIDGTGTTV